MATTTSGVAELELDTDDSRKARVLYDYEAENEDELTVPEGEVTIVTWFYHIVGN